MGTDLRCVSLQFDDPHIDRGVPPLLPHFTGRTRLLEQLESIFSQETSRQQVVILYGLGGMGKTEIATRFAREQKAQRYEHVLWIDYTSAETIQASYRRIVSSLFLAAENCPKAEIMGYLARNSRCLLIFDNVTKNLPDECFPESKHDVLITARYANVCRGTEIVVPALPTKRAIQLYCKITGKRRSDGVDALVAHLGAISLAIDQAAHFSRAAKVSAAEYVEAYRGTPLQSGMQPDSRRHNATITTVWKRTIDRMPSEAMQVLETLALFHHHDLPTRFLISFTLDIRALLLDFALIQKVQVEGKRSFFRMNHMLQAYLRDHLRTPERALAHAAAAMAQNFHPGLGHLLGPTIVLERGLDFNLPVAMKQIVLEGLFLIYSLAGLKERAKEMARQFYDCTEKEELPSLTQKGALFSISPNETLSRQIVSASKGKILSIHELTGLLAVYCHYRRKKQYKTASRMLGPVKAYCKKRFEAVQGETEALVAQLLLQLISQEPSKEKAAFLHETLSGLPQTAHQARLACCLAAIDLLIGDKSLDPINPFFEESKKILLEEKASVAISFSQLMMLIDVASVKEDWPTAKGFKKIADRFRSRRSAQSPGIPKGLSRALQEADADNASLLTEKISAPGSNERSGQSRSVLTLQEQLWALTLYDCLEQLSSHA